MSLFLLHPAVLAEWTISSPVKYKTWEDLEDQVHLQVHFTNMTLEAPKICVHGRSSNTNGSLQFRSNSGIKFYYITLPSVS